MTSVPLTGWQEADTELFLCYADAFVPRRAEQFTTVCALLAPLPRQRVLELGCGAGVLTAHILSAMPPVSVTAVDASPEMVAVARTRLARFGNRVTVSRADLTDLSWRTDTWGGVVTSLAVHHLDDAGKRKLYGVVYELLAPGGLFVQADMFQPVTPTGVALAGQLWDSLVEAQSRSVHGSDEAFTAFRRAAWNTFQHPDPADHPAALGDQVRWLTEVGFVGVDVAWALAGHAVLTATRPEVGAAR